jgi:two-component system alkaline phosphatase synthesis response regulator PhoP
MAKKILVVDDEAHIRAALTAALESEGYTVEQAENGKKAVEMCKTFRPDLAILDVRMPVMDGHMASIEIRYDESLKNVKFMFLSANADEDSKDYAFGHGAEAYLTKPFKVEDLLARVEKILKPKPVEAPKKEAKPAEAEAIVPEVKLDEKAKEKYLEDLKRKFNK